MSDCQPSNTKSNLNEILKENGHLIQNEVEKLKNDTEEFISKTISIPPAQVNIVKMSQEKIIIEVNLKPVISDQSSKNELSYFGVKNMDIEPKFNLTQSTPIREMSKNRSTSVDELDKSLLDEENNCKEKRQDLEFFPLSRTSSRRTSESSDKPCRGILKYPNGWKKRTLSESSYEHGFLLTDQEDEVDFNSTLNSFSCTDLDLVGDKPVKKVTFNKQVKKNVFKKNSSIVKKQRKEMKFETIKQDDKINQNKTCENSDQAKNVNEKTTEKSTIESRKKKIVNNNLLKVYQENGAEKKSEEVNEDLSYILFQSDSETSDIKNSVDTQEITNAENNLNNGNVSQTASGSGWSEVKSKKSKKNKKKNDNEPPNPSKEDSSCNLSINDNSISDQLNSSSSIQIEVN